MQVIGLNFEDKLKLIDELSKAAPLNESDISEEFCESFHEASMSVIQEIKKGKKLKFVKIV